MDPQRLSTIAQRYGTPCFVFDEEALAQRMREIGALVGERVRLCYSIKANPFLIPAMRHLVGLLEVCSPGELAICEALGVAPDTILFSGVNKTAGDIAHAMDAGVTHFTAESPLHVALLEREAAARGKVYPVLLRLTAGTQFGMDEADLLRIVDEREQTPHLRFEGLHYFAGTQRKKLSEQEAELERLAAFMDKLEAEHGFPVRQLEYGPGLYFPYFAHEDASDTLAPLRELAPHLRRMAERTQLTVEMGRFFVSACGTYLTTVADTKVNCGYHYAILDGGIHHVNYIGGNMGMRVPRIAHLPGPNHEAVEGCSNAGDCQNAETCFNAHPDQQDWQLCGSLCTTADVLVRKVPLNGLVPGDVLAFQSIGAYSVTEGPALFLSRDLPKIVLAGKDGERLARDTVHASDLNRPRA